MTSSNEAARGLTKIIQEEKLDRENFSGKFCATDSSSLTSIQGTLPKFWIKESTEMTL